MAEHAALILGDLALARRIETADGLNNAGYTLTLEQFLPGCGAELLSFAGAAIVKTGIMLPINRVFALGLNAEITATQLEEIEYFYARASLPTQVEITPLTGNTLLRLLGERGYRAHSFYNVYARMLSPTESFKLPSDGITITRVAEHDRDTWASTAAHTTDTAQPIYALACSAFYRPGASAYLAAWNGTPAGAGLLTVRDGTAALSFMHTMPAYRGHGIQHALLYARLADAAAQDCDIAITTSVPGNASQRNMLRVGFQIVYTKLVMEKAFTT